MAASTKTKPKSLNQNELRRLMKERREKVGNTEKKIDSPLAKYNNLGQLFCSICNIQVKKEGLWLAHTVNKTHKNALEAIRGKKNSIKTADLLKSEYRKRDSSFLDDKKQNDKDTSSDIEPVDEDAPKDNLKSNEIVKEKTVAAVLPPDFFDSNIPAPETSNVKGEETPLGKGEPLPEGFFDDPKKDAKARKVEYKDPMDDEWEKFQKTINEETNVSQAIIDVDVEESKVERDIDELDEQIHNWARVEALLNRREKFATTNAASGRNSDDSGSSSDEDIDKYLNWRDKGMLNK